MFGRKFKSMLDGIQLDNATEDYKITKRIGQYHVSQNAIYKADGYYLPFCAVTDKIVDKTTVHVSGCCAGGVFVDRIIFVTEEKKFPFIFDDEKSVQRVLELYQTK